MPWPSPAETDAVANHYARREAAQADPAHREHAGPQPDTDQRERGEPSSLPDRAGAMIDLASAVRESGRVARIDTNATSDAALRARGMSTSTVWIDMVANLDQQSSCGESANVPSAMSGRQSHVGFGRLVCDPGDAGRRRANSTTKITAGTHCRGPEV